MLGQPYRASRQNYYFISLHSIYLSNILLTMTNQGSKKRSKKQVEADKTEPSQEERIQLAIKRLHQDEALSLSKAVK